MSNKLIHQLVAVIPGKYDNPYKIVKTEYFCSCGVSGFNQKSLAEHIELENE